MKDIIVVDLDGTLANIDHRLHFIKQEKPDWKGFYKACNKDSVNEWCFALIRALTALGKDVRIVTARSQEAYLLTSNWLQEHGVDDYIYKFHFVRGIGDYTSDDELKIKWLNESGLKDRILFVVDDRQRVVDMWRKEGLVCLQCYAWPEWKKPK